MTRTTPRARTREDRNGDPLDGLVNMFDLGIVLAVAFLLAALSSLKLTGALATDSTKRSAAAIVVGRDQTTRALHVRSTQRVAGHGTRVGSVYRLANGQLVYVAPRTPRRRTR